MPKTEENDHRCRKECFTKVMDLSYILRCELSPRKERYPNGNRVNTKKTPILVSKT